MARRAAAQAPRRRGIRREPPRRRPLGDALGAPHARWRRRRPPHRHHGPQGGAGVLAREPDDAESRAQKLSGTGSVVRNLQTKATEWSDEMYRIFGVDRETFVPGTDEFRALIHPEDRDLVSSAKRVITYGASNEVEPSVEFRASCNLTARSAGSIAKSSSSATVTARHPAMRARDLQGHHRAARRGRYYGSASLRCCCATRSRVFPRGSSSTTPRTGSSSATRPIAGSIRESAEIIVPGIRYADLVARASGALAGAGRTRERPRGGMDC